MNFPQITMHSTYGQIEINTQNASLTIEQPPVDLSIEQPKAEMTVNRIPSKLTIDQSKARADVDLKSARQRIEDAAQQGQQSVAQGIARRAQEGEELMKIENGGNPIAQQAKQHNLIPEQEFGLGCVPSLGSVKIDYDPGQLNINWTTHKSIINSQSHKPIINFYPGKINISMKQYPSLNIDISL
jgi:hypothetical protein